MVEYIERQAVLDAIPQTNEDKTVSLFGAVSTLFVLKIAARAAGVHSSVIENLPLADANIVRKKARSFFMHGE